MKVTIFQAGLVPEKIRDQFPTYGEMIADLIGGEPGQFQFETISLLEGDLVPAIEDVEAIVISGSAFGVYDQTDWMDPLRDLIRAAYESDIPTIGICFGHQLIADALGGTVEKSSKGWGLGRHTYQIQNRPAFMASGPDTQTFSVVHQDQVVVPPRSATVVGGNSFTPNAMLAYENGVAFSLQAHPEFEDSYTKELFDQRKGHAFSVEQGDAAKNEIKGSNHNALLGECFRLLLNVR